ncbi:4-hydroxyphenylacetate 3-monooxygenase, oxygenase component [Falsibacillus albus]|uniref:4-hydroxyphenylacetate 3-monooxygenase, oxygenase component n=1 Tax=Falsibacillus albus TaxID=2478915 RepID=A0A3L7JQI4_9BACI|nr:4-hydroxyphenylacetate 3-monooxygenase, oxygenase component [Falsibacillus albus]RLQ93077.1 4-hydroxyphenylacetate 3-monooxygenase, oxygenase component [Falsibacillus albus]
MGIISGKQFINRIDDLHNEVWIHGKKVDGKISNHTAFKGMLHSKAKLFDMQTDPRHQPLLTFALPGTSEKANFSFKQPATKADLTDRRLATQLWAKTNAGLLGRSPDYINSAIMSLAAAAPLLGKNNKKFGKNIRQIYERAAAEDLTFTHTFINPQTNRSISFFESDDMIIAAKVVDENSDGIVVKGARLLATQGGLTDELLVLPAGGNFIDESYIYGFIIPSNTPGLKFMCRESFVSGDSEFDYPFSTKYEEIDSVVVFDDVLVPWERVFLYKDLNIAFEMTQEVDMFTLLSFQSVTRQVVKTEFILGLTQLIIDAINISEFQHVKDKASEIIVGLEIMKSLLLTSENQCQHNTFGMMTPEKNALNAAIIYYPKLYPRLVEVIHLLGASGLITLPTEKDFLSDNTRPYIDQYLQGAGSDSLERVKIFRLAWDLTMSSFGSRQTLYERFFFGDPVKLAMSLYNGYDKTPYVEMVKELLD